MSMLATSNQSLPAFLQKWLEFGDIAIQVIIFHLDDEKLGPSPFFLSSVPESSDEGKNKIVPKFFIIWVRAIHIDFFSELVSISMAPFVYIFSLYIAEGKSHPLHGYSHILMVGVHHLSQTKFHLELLCLCLVSIKYVDMAADFSGVDPVSLLIIIVWIFSPQWSSSWWVSSWLISPWHPPRWFSTRWSSSSISVSKGPLWGSNIV